MADLQSSSGGGSMNGGGAPAVSIGNYKGVMLCNRPFAGAGGAAAKGGAGSADVGGAGKSFRTGVMPKPHGANVCITSKEINPAIANREKKQTALHRHRAWLSELQGTKDHLEAKFMDHVSSKEDSKARFMQREARWRARVRARDGGGGGGGGGGEMESLGPETSSDGGGEYYNYAASDAGAAASGRAGLADAPLAADSEVMSQLGKLAAAESRREKTGGKVAARPKWAMTEEAAAVDDAAAEDDEVAEMLAFADGLDFDKYMEASDMCCSYMPAQWVVVSCLQWAAGEKMCHLPSRTARSRASWTTCGSASPSSRARRSSRSRPRPRPTPRRSASAEAAAR